MYIRRKVFSLLQDESGETKYFSTTDITMEDAEQRIFSEKKESKVDLAKARTGIFTGDKGKGRKAANKAAEEGKSEVEIIEAAGNAAKKSRLKKDIASTALGSAALGYAAKNALSDKSNREAIIKVARKSTAPTVRKAVAAALKHPGKTGVALVGATGLSAIPAIIRNKKGAEAEAMRDTVKRIKKGNKE